MKIERLFYNPPAVEWEEAIAERGYVGSGDVTPDNWEGGESDWW